MIGVGFEPTPPKRLVPKTSALDRSAIQPKIQGHRVWHTENGKVFGNARWKIKNRKPFATKNSPTGIRTRVVWVKTTYPDQLDYWGWAAPAGNQTRVSSVAGTYTITVLPAHVLYRLRNGESNPGHLRDRQRCYQLHHIGSFGVSGFRSQYLVLAKHARFRLRQYPVDTWGIRTPACIAHSLSRRAP